MTCYASHLESQLLTGINDLIESHQTAIREVSLFNIEERNASDGSQILLPKYFADSVEVYHAWGTPLEILASVVTRNDDVFITIATRVGEFSYWRYSNSVFLGASQWEYWYGQPLESFLEMDLESSRAQGIASCVLSALGISLEFRKSQSNTLELSA